MWSSMCCSRVVSGAEVGGHHVKLAPADAGLRELRVVCIAAGMLGYLRPSIPITKVAM
jgi:hypothetical protein